jgi:hypothetical protein
LKAASTSQSIAALARQLQMRMPAREELRRWHAGQRVLELVVGRRRQQRLDLRAWRAVEAEEGHALGPDRQGRRQAGEVLEVVATERRPRPGDDLAEPARLVTASRRQPVEQPALSVAAHAAAVALAEAGDHRLWLRPAGGNVAEADDLVDAPARQLSEDSVESDAVAVDVADQRQALHASAARPSPR